MNRAHTTAFIVRNEDGYFVAYLDNGGVRVGLEGCAAFDFPAGHAKHAEAMALNNGTVEAFFDAQCEIPHTYRM